MKYQFTVVGVRWFDKVNGNTYHSVKIVNNLTGEIITSPIQYGYGEAYKQTALERMLEAGWIPEKYGIKNTNGSSNLYQFERDNYYPIYWTVFDGLKRDCINNREI